MKLALPEILPEPPAIRAISIFFDPVRRAPRARLSLAGTTLSQVTIRIGALNV